MNDTGPLPKDLLNGTFCNGRLLSRFNACISVESLVVIGLGSCWMVRGLSCLFCFGLFCFVLNVECFMFWVLSCLLCLGALLGCN